MSSAGTSAQPPPRATSSRASQGGKLIRQNRHQPFDEGSLIHCLLL